MSTIDDGPKSYDDIIREQFADSVKEGRNVFFMRNDLKKDKKTLKNRKDLDNSKFTATDLTEANLSNSDLNNSLFDFTQLIGANLSKTNLEGSIFETATNLNDANLKGANLKNAKFIRAHVDGTDFEGAHLDGVYFDPEQVYHLDRANFKGTIFEGTPGYGNNYTGKSIEKEEQDKRKEERREKKETKKNTLNLEQSSMSLPRINKYETPLEEVRRITKVIREEEEIERKEQERMNQIIEENKNYAPVKGIDTNTNYETQDIISELFEKAKKQKDTVSGTGSSKGGKKRRTKNYKKSSKRKRKSKRKTKKNNKSIRII